MKKISHDTTFNRMLFALCLLLSSCATMKNADTRPIEGTCMTGYDSAKIGEKEALAGIILMSVGGGMVISNAIPLGIENERHPNYNTGTYPVFVSLIVTGSLALVTGMIVLADGHVRVNGWNRYCVGATPAERYCLINEPIPFAPLSMEILP